MEKLELTKNVEELTNNGPEMSGGCARFLTRGLDLFDMIFFQVHFSWVHVNLR